MKSKKYRKLISLVVLMSFIISLLRVEVIAHENESSGNEVISNKDIVYDSEEVDCTQLENCVADVHLEGCSLYSNNEDINIIECEQQNNDIQQIDSDNSLIENEVDTKVDIKDTKIDIKDNEVDTKVDIKDNEGEIINLQFTRVSWTHIYGLTNGSIIYPRVRDAGDITLEEIISTLNKDLNSMKVSYTYTYTPTSDGGESNEPITVTRNDILLENIEWSDKNMSFDNIKKALADNPEGSKGFKRNSYKVTINPEYIISLIKNYEESKSEGIDILEINANNDDIAGKSFIKFEFGPYSGYTTKSPSQEVLSSNTISTVSPRNVKLNLYDYWISEEGYSDIPGDTVSGDDPNWKQVVTSGVNNGHGLIFRSTTNSMGSWNAWTGRTGGVRAGIVGLKLGDDGFPVLNLKKSFGSNGLWSSRYPQYKFSTEESFSYLFDATNKDMVDSNGEKYGIAYEDVKGLFHINDEGNYYYSSHDNFAEFDETENKFNIYNTWGINKSGSSPNGQFYPFNSADIVFKDNGNGTLTQSGIKALDREINHYLGLTMEVEFQQPINGMVSVGDKAKPMLFEFSGDDDVWIFLDDVLIADLGGIHDELSVSIDFSTGKIHIQRVGQPTAATTIDTTIREQVEKAGATDEVLLYGDTLAGNTTHKIKMFYLERGNTDSNLTLSFNLLEPVENNIIKFDQRGNELSDAEFELYIAKTDENGEPIINENTGEYEVLGDPISSNFVTDENGECVLPNYDFSRYKYYILRETAPPEGYFSQGDIVLRYDALKSNPDGTSSGTNMLLVENRWTTGALTSFKATVYQAGMLKYDNSVGDYRISEEQGKQGLILGVPLMKDKNGDWFPLFGSGMIGYNTIPYDTSSENKVENQRRAILTAALYQIYSGVVTSTKYENYDFHLWYLDWSEEDGRYYGLLENMPGDVNRYYWATTDPNMYDMTMAYYFLDLHNIDDSIINSSDNATTQEKLQAIADAIDVEPEAGKSKEEAVKESVKNLVNDITSIDNKLFGLLNIESFNRLFSSTIRVPNVEPELGVMKLDEDGEPIEGVTLSIYEGDSATGTPLATGTTNDEGILVFSARGTGNPGSAKMMFSSGNYTLVETNVPENSGYIINRAEVPVVITQNGRVYADALEENDGITVHKGLGKLLQSVVRYASKDSVDSTLKDISATLVTGEEVVGSGIDNMTETNPVQSLDLHYGLDNALIEYGIHTVNGIANNPYFEVDKDFAGIVVKQNYDAHLGEIIYSTTDKKTDLQDINIRKLFTGSTTVVIRNRSSDKGAFSISKSVTGSGANLEKQFTFDVKLTGNADNGSDCPNLDGYYYNVIHIGDDGTEEVKETGILNFKEQNSNYYITTVTTDGKDESLYMQENKESGYYYVKLANNYKLTVTGLPFGITVQATEIDGDGYRTSVRVNGGIWYENTDTVSGTIAQEIGNPILQFANHKDQIADLILEKIVPEGGGNQEQKFPFTIMLKDSNNASLLTGEYMYTVHRKGVSIESGTTKTGNIQVELASQDKLTVHNIPIGSTYIIRETALGYSPMATIGGKNISVVDGSILGTILDTNNGNDNLNSCVYTNIRSGSITITKRTGTGNILNGAGFTIYKVDSDGSLNKLGQEILTTLAMREIIEDADNDVNFDKITMRYTVGTSSYIVHTEESDGNKGYFYYRFLTDSERKQYYNGTLEKGENVETVVQFTDLDLNTKYAIRETTVPNGYVQNADFEATMSDIILPKSDGTNEVYDILYTVTNHEGMVLPSSGLMGIATILGIGVTLLGIAILLARLSINMKKKTS